MNNHWLATLELRVQYHRTTTELKPHQRTHHDQPWQNRFIKVWISLGVFDNIWWRHSSTTFELDAGWRHVGKLKPLHVSHSPREHLWTTYRKEYEQQGKCSTFYSNEYYRFKCSIIKYYLNGCPLRLGSDAISYLKHFFSLDWSKGQLCSFILWTWKYFS